MDPSIITIKGAREHNLRGVSLTLPKGKLICFTGVSGSGKSSLAFDTLFAEGQRRYIESLSSYARQFLGQLPKPDVDQISGLSPAISIQQKTGGWNPRSTVGTITQIHDYLRVLFARVGRQHCPNCGRTISAQSREQIVARVLELPEGTKFLILAPVIRGKKGEYKDLFEDMLRRGYARARVDGKVAALSDVPALSRNIRHDIEIVVDRLSITPTVRPRLAEAVEAALKLGDGTLVVQVTDEAGIEVPATTASEADDAHSRRRKPATRKTRLNRSGARSTASTSDMLLSSHYACPACALSFEPPSPQLFSFNSPAGMCQRCDGLGTVFDFDTDKLVPHPRRSFLGLAIEPMRTKIGRWRRHIYEAVAQYVGFDLKTPWEKLPEKAKRALLHGTGDTHLTFEWRSAGGVWRHGGKFEGVLAELREKHRGARSSIVRAYYEKYMRRAPCAECGGARLSTQARAVRIGGKSITEVCALSIADCDAYFAKMSLTPTENRIAADVVREIRGRLGFLRDVGLDYLTLDRTAPTLSGGESQRIRLASQIGAGLVGVLYVLDEPSIGLHHRDNQRLLDSLCRLRDLGNTVVVVEHDEQTMRAADMIVDFGPGPGVRGGEVVAQGSLDDLLQSERSLTGKFLRGEERIEIPAVRRPVEKKGDRQRAEVGNRKRAIGNRKRKDPGA